MSLPSSIDVAIVRRGRRGLGAAHALKKSGLSAIVLEARDRGRRRAHTIFGHARYPLRRRLRLAALGRPNSFVAIAEQLISSSIRATRPGASRVLANLPADTRRVHQGA